MNRNYYTEQMPLPAYQAPLTQMGQSPWTGFGAENTALPNLNQGEVAGASPWYAWDNLMGSNKMDPKTGAVLRDSGTLAPALGVAQGVFNAWMGMKQYGLAKQQLAEGKQQFALNYDAQRTTTNSQLEDRQRARVASNPGAYQSVSTYLDANSIKPRGG